MFINLLLLIIEALNIKTNNILWGKNLFPNEKTLSDMSYTKYNFCKSL